MLCWFRVSVVAAFFARTSKRVVLRPTLLRTFFQILSCQTVDSRMLVNVCATWKQMRASCASLVGLITSVAARSPCARARTSDECCAVARLRATRRDFQFGVTDSVRHRCHASFRSCFAPRAAMRASHKSQEKSRATITAPLSLP